MRRSAQRPPPLFCSAPWLEATIRINGDVFPCCRSNCKFGSLESESLADVWVSDAAQEFRRSIRKGKFPEKNCEECFRAGTHSTLNSTFSAVLGQYWTRLSKGADTPPPESLCKAFSYFHSLIDRNDPATIKKHTLSMTLLALHDARERTGSDSAKQTLKKLERVVVATADFVKGEKRPQVVATFRQVNLVSICNARCVHCLGNVNKEIARGTKIGGKRHKFMSSRLQSQAMTHRGDITRYYMNGSEFFLYKDFRKILYILVLNYIYFSISTNGMLLTPKNVDALLGSRCLSSINISFDGATRRTVEKIRRGVSYNTLLENTQYLLQAMHERCIRLPVSISMVLLRDNIEEAAKVVQLVYRLRNGMDIDIHVNFQVLEHSPANEYQAFRAGQCREVHDASAFPHLARAARVADDLGVEVYYGPNEQLCHAIARMPA